MIYYTSNKCTFKMIFLVLLKILSLSKQNKISSTFNVEGFVIFKSIGTLGQTVVLSRAAVQSQPLIVSPRMMLTIFRYDGKSTKNSNNARLNQTQTKGNESEDYRNEQNVKVRSNL